MNVKLIEAAFGMLARMVPEDAWQQIVGELKAITEYAKSADARLAKLEALVERVDFLENIVRNSVDGAGAAFGERAMYMAHDGEAIREALAPAIPGAINGRGNQNG